MQNLALHSRSSQTTKTGWLLFPKSTQAMFLGCSWSFSRRLGEKTTLCVITNKRRVKPDDSVLLNHLDKTFSQSDCLLKIRPRAAPSGWTRGCRTSSTRPWASSSSRPGRWSRCERGDRAARLDCLRKYIQMISHGLVPQRNVNIYMDWYRYQRCILALIYSPL